jgi:DNA repair protein RadC
MQVRLTKEQKIKIANSDDVYTIIRAVLMRQNKLHRKREYFWVMGLNTGNDIMYIELAAIGKVNAANVDPVELFSFAVQKKCKKIILIHNHPSGNLTPSAEDIHLTNQLKEGAKYLKIEILEHLIISEEGFSSVPIS